MKSIATVVFLCLASALIISSCNKDETPNRLINISDSAFIRKASMSNFAEITLGQVAADSSSDSSIARFGQQMVAEHTAAQQQLQPIASEIGIGLTTTLDPQHQMLLDSLLTLKDRAFDSIYIHSQVLDHELAVDFFKQQSGHGLQKDLRQYVYQVLPAIEEHLQAAKILASKY
jgi:putative membrane protein